MVEGFATEKDTEKLKERFPELEYNLLGSTGLHISQAGFGTYRVDISIEEHRQALHLALKKGLNIIDTSSNYTDGGSERMVGAVVDEAIEQQDIKRKEVVVVTKAGYLQGENYQMSMERKTMGKTFPDLVEYSMGLEHCIHPEFLEDQIERSLKRLFMTNIDVFLLHNPEYYLSWAKTNGIPLEEARAEYYSRIEKAFRFLETKVEEEVIQYYGISSNTFPKAADDAEFTSLEKVWEIAESISKNHHFRVIQFPMNLFENGAVLEKNQPNGQTVLEFAKEKNIGVLINRPLNAIIENKLIRLADVQQDKPVSEEKIEKFIDDLTESENKFINSHIFTLKLDDRLKKQLIDYLFPGQTLKKHWKEFTNYTQWYDVLTQYFNPRISSATEHLSHSEDLPVHVSYWLDEHIGQIERVTRAIDSHYKIEAAEQALKIKEIVSSSDSDWKSPVTLSQKALRALRSTEGVSTVLLGMRQSLYVEDIFKELQAKCEMKNRKESWEKMKDNFKSAKI